MREIKFRGKEAETGKWIYGDIHQWNDGRFFIAQHDETWNDDGFHSYDYLCVKEVSEETIGQFTGLYDKNGREIYEGDILKYTRTNFKSGHLKKEKIEEIYVVFWNESKHAFYCHTEFENGGVASGFLVFEDERAEKNEIEVVGNRFDNPKLLKGGEQ